MNAKSSFGLHTHRKSDFTGDRVGEEEPALGKNDFQRCELKERRKVMSNRPGISAPSSMPKIGAINSPEGVQFRTFVAGGLETQNEENLRLPVI
jgi:hypothetical protein